MYYSQELLVPIWLGLELYIRSWDFGAALPQLSCLHPVECCLQLHPICTMRTGPIHEVPAYAHWPNSHFPHGWCTIMCPPYTLSIDILSIFLHPGAATHVPNLVTSPHLDAVAHLVTPLGAPFHHKPAPVASFILCLEYLLCAHHPPSPSSNIPHCTRTHTPAPSPAALPHLDMPIHPCFPLPGGIFTTNQP